MKRRPSLAAACAQFTNRFTAEHVPAWARQPAPNGRYYAPQYASDAEWYARTMFDGESPLVARGQCFSTKPTWPLGKWLDAPHKATRRA